MLARQHADALIVTANYHKLKVSFLAIHYPCPQTLVYENNKRSEKRQR